MNWKIENDLYDDSGAAHQHQLEVQEWWNTIGWLEEANEQLQIASNEMREN